MAALNADLKVYGKNYSDDIAVPQNTTAYSSSVDTGTKGVLGSINVKLFVGTTGLSVAATQILTVTLQSSADNISFTDIILLYTITGAAQAPTTAAAGLALMQIVIPPNALRYTRLKYISDDAAGTGTLIAYPQYLPR